jgi:hypothetical protein
VVSCILSMWPSHHILWHLMNLPMFREQLNVYVNLWLNEWEEICSCFFARIRVVCVCS